MYALDTILHRILQLRTHNAWITWWGENCRVKGINNTISHFTFHFDPIYFKIKFLFEIIVDSHEVKK